MNKLTSPVALTMPKLKGLALQGYETLDVAALPWKELQEKQPLPPGFEQAKRSRSRLVLSMDYNSERVFVKRAIARSLENQLSAVLQGTKLRREWEISRQFLEQDIKVPEPLLYAEAGKVSYLVTRGFPETWKPLSRIFKEEGLSQELLDRIAEFTRWLHSLPAYHHDYRSDHLYLSNLEGESPREWFALLDLDGAFVGRTPGRAAREEALFELFLSLLRRDLSPEQAKRFTKIYSKGLKLKIDAKELYRQATLTFTENRVAKEL